MSDQQSYVTIRARQPADGAGISNGALPVRWQTETPPAISFPGSVCNLAHTGEEEEDNESV